MEENEFYVYPGGSYFLCGGCGWSLSPYQPERRPFKMRVCCFNTVCPKYLTVFLIGDEHRIAAFDTGERATVTPPLQPPTQPGGARNAANIGNVTAPEAPI